MGRSRNSQQLEATNNSNASWAARVTKLRIGVAQVSVAQNNQA
jgi:hypothetical protein